MHKGPDSVGSFLIPAESLDAGELSVRRLTPVECERLQGYPDGRTARRAVLTVDGVRWKREPAETEQADSGRYRQLGNSIAVPVFEWLARRMAAHDRGLR